MNKEKLLFAFNKMGKAGFNKLDIFILLGSLVLGAISLDLDLHYLSVISGFLIYAQFMWFICSFVSLVVTEIIIRKRNAKSNIEKLIDEESRKE